MSERREIPEGYESSDVLDRRSLQPVIPSLTDLTPSRTSERRAFTVASSEVEIEVDFVGFELGEREREVDASTIVSGWIGREYLGLDVPWLSW